MNASLPFTPVAVAIMSLFLTVALPAHAEVNLRGKITDADTGALLPARLYIHSAGGDWAHATSASEQGRAVPYHVRRSGRSFEIHTSLSAHPFQASLPPGRYTLTVERGKEYLPKTVEISLPESSEAPTDVTIPLQRWSNLAAEGWYSGETHTHRPLSELPTLVLAEDLNVTLPLTAWVTDSRQTPATANKNPERVRPAKLIEVDATHVIWPVNTEYEIFTVNGKQHTLGAVFVLNHREAFDLPAPPVAPIAAEARRQGALLDLDKHNWPWSMMLLPTMEVDFFELTNNHLWRTDFLFKDWYPEYAEGLEVERDAEGNLTERGWIDFGFLNYYALLNCGFRMNPSAGTASGVHPVPLGFGRVYVQIDGPFSYNKWIDGLQRGQSFVTTGPRLTTRQERSGDRVTVSGTFASSVPLGRVEIVRNGQVIQSLEPESREGENGGQWFDFSTQIRLSETSWIALRGFENRHDNRPRFAHTAPVWHEVAERPLRPRKEEVDYLVKRVQNELARHHGVLSETALAEYQTALDHYLSLPTQD